MFNSVLLVREICKKRGIPVAKIEKDCGFSNGYLNPKKQTKIPYDRALLLSNYLGISVDYILTGTEKSAPADGGKRAFGENINLTQTELDLLHKFRQLDDRGRSTVINTLEHEYSALSQPVRSEGVSPADNSRSILRIAARDGSYQERTLSDHQVADLQAFLDQLPDVPEGL